MQNIEWSCSSYEKRWLGSFLCWRLPFWAQGAKNRLVVSLCIYQLKSNRVWKFSPGQRLDSLSQGNPQSSWATTMEKSLWVIFMHLSCFLSVQSCFAFIKQSDIYTLLLLSVIAFYLRWRTRLSLSLHASQDMK